MLDLLRGAKTSPVPFTTQHIGKRQPQTPSPCLPVSRRPASSTFDAIYFGDDNSFWRTGVLASMAGGDKQDEKSTMSAEGWTARHGTRLHHSPRRSNSLHVLDHPKLTSFSQPRPRLGRSRSCRKAPQASRWSWSCRWSAPPPYQHG